MRNLIILLTVIVSLMGCSNDNQITIINDAQAPVSFNFRANETVVPSGQQSTIKDIPNGSYDVAIGINLPAGTTSSSVSPTSATFTFNRKSTKIAATFGSTFIDGAYTVTWNYSSTDPITSTATSITSP